MKAKIHVDDMYVIPENHFNNLNYIEKRISSAVESDKGCLRTALKYLYLLDGPINLPKDRLNIAEKYFEPAEGIIARWLVTRTNGKLRSKYGKDALNCAQKSYYHCNICGYPDVRTLQLDHVDGKILGTAFNCLCTNYHSIKSREKDWDGTKRY